MQTRGQKIGKHEFSEHLLALKKTLIFMILINLLLVFSLGSTLNENLSDFLIVILAPTLMVGGILYLMYAEHNRLIESLEKSTVLDFLSDLKFDVNERNTGWEFVVDIQGNLANCTVAIFISKEKGFFWNRYYLNPIGVLQNPINETRAVYADPIRLKPIDSTKLNLEESLKELIQELQKQK